MTPATFKKVLFVCTGNYYRSRFAEAYFNHLAQQRGIPMRAFSRGLMIHLAEPGLSTHTRRYLRELNIDESHTAPERMSLDEDALRQASRSICLYEKEHRPMVRHQFPQWEDRLEYWTLPDLDEVGPESTLPGIRQKVDKLLDYYQAQNPNHCA